MTIALAMMAKAPAETVLRAIESARHLVDRVCLVVAPGDPLTRAGLELQVPLPVRIVEEPWVGHASNRTRTLQIAESDATVDWILMLDADDRFAKGSVLPPLDANVDAYSIPVDCLFKEGRWRWRSPMYCVRARRGLRYAGTNGSEVHEALKLRPGGVIGRFDGLVYRYTNGATAPHENAETLGKTLGKNAADHRGVFYFAHSLRDAGKFHEAYVAFVARAGMNGGNVEETFWASLWAAKLAPSVGASATECELRYMRAHAIFPERAEPLAGLATFLRNRGQHARAMQFDVIASTKPYPVDAERFIDVMAYSTEALAAAGIPITLEP